MTRKIDILIKTLTPLHIASFEPFSHYGTQLSADQAKTIIGAWTERYYAGGAYPEKIYVIPSNDIKGRARRQAAHMILEQLGNVELPLFQALTTGALPGGPSEGSNVDIKQRVAEMQDVFLGSFGGGQNLSPSGFAIHSAFLVTPDNRKRFADLMDQNDEFFKHVEYDAKEVSETSKRTSDNPALTHIYPKTSLDDVLRGTDDLSKFVIDWEDRAAEYAKEVGDVNVSRKEEGSTAKKLDKNLVFGFEAIVPGAFLYLRVDLSDRLSDAQVGMVLLSLKAMLANPIGGHVASGCGCVTSKFQITHDEIKLDMDQFESAAKNAINELKLDDVEELYGVSKAQIKARREAKAEKVAKAKKAADKKAADKSAADQE